MQGIVSGTISVTTNQPHVHGTLHGDPASPEVLHCRAMDPRPQTLGPRGFTLVELLVGLTLMALISIALFGGMRFGMRAWETGSERFERLTRIELVQSLVRRQLGQARPSRPGNPVPTFVGQIDRVVFIAPSPKQGDADADFLFVLAKTEAHQQSQLDLTWTSSGASASGETTLIDNIASVELGYYGAPDPQRPAQWSTQWDGAGGLPALVRVRLTFPKGDERRWPDLIVHVVQGGPH